MLRNSLIDRRFNRMVVLDHIGKYCKCQCDCGMVKLVTRGGLMSGKTGSCGCLRKEMSSARSKTHGQTGTPEYRAYRNAKNRCERPIDVRFYRYGGRGIKMLFKNFDEFIAAIGPRPNSSLTLDRINTNGHYEPGNVQWVTQEEQARNKENSIRITMDGEVKNLKEWCEIYGQQYKRAWERMHEGWSAERAIKLPAGQTARRKIVHVECDHVQD